MVEPPETGHGPEIEQERPPRRPPRFKEPPKSAKPARHKPRRPADESVFIEAAELDSVFHHVDQLGEGTDRVSFRDSASPDREAKMDMTPMVDVTFLLLIFFMVTAAFNLQKSLDVPTPKPDQPSENVQQRDPQEDPDLVTVQVDRFNTFRVITTDWDVEAPSVPEMLIKLREATQGNSQGRKPSTLLVMASPEALHEKVVAALDGGTAEQMAKIQLMMMEDEE
jgi:biopolymer transport protein ExbD